MIFLRYLLFPFSIIYGCITAIRNFLYDNTILKSYSFKIPIIAVGNLSVGGTGKTPHVEYLIRLFQDTYKVATLSRGYKRKSSGFIIANKDATAELVGDEPFQMYLKFPKINVAVDADRKNGIEKLLALKDKPDVILLDDAFQHRKVKAGFYILLTSYNDLYYNDLMLPTGNLREYKSGAKRANMIIVTKCPEDISEIAQQNIKNKIGLNLPVFFSCISYDDYVYNENEKIAVSEIKKVEKILVAGIAKPESFYRYLQNENDEVLTFNDHHQFTIEEIEALRLQTKTKKIITTEKDYVRLKDKSLENLYYLPIQPKILKSNEFENYLLNYVGTSTRNS
jgi:tetraacyldisaccharide 4'-kinase